MVARCPHSGCISEFVSPSQLDAHVAFKHVPVEEITFTCAKCKALFHTGTALLKHKLDEHQDGEQVSDTQTMCNALAGSQSTKETNGNRADDNDKENAAPAKKHRYQCNRCTYSTEHSAWLLQQHVIYEHLVDALGMARDCDAGLHVPQVGRFAGTGRYTDFGPFAYGGGAEQQPPFDGHMDMDSAMGMPSDYGDGGEECDPADGDYESSYGDGQAAGDTAATPAGRAAKRPRAAPGAKTKKCAHCPYTSNRPAHMRDHVAYAHGGGQTPRAGAKHKQKPSTSAAGGKVDKVEPEPAGRFFAYLHCDRCPYRSYKRAHLQRHVAAVHEGARAARHLCDICGVFASVRRDHLAKHRPRCMRRHGVLPPEEAAARAIDEFYW